MKIVIFGILTLIILVNSCKKPKGDKFCTWTSKTTDMVVLLNCNENDTCKFDTLEILVKFETEYINNSPPCGSFNDSVIGNIKKLNVYVNYFVDNDTLVENINNIIKFNIKYFNNETLANNLEYINSYHPRCNNYIYLYLTNSTDTNCLQTITVKYEENNGKIYESTSKPICIQQ